MSKKNGDSSANWIDVSVPLREGMVVFAYENNMQIERRHSMDRGDMGNNSSIHMGVHTVLIGMICDGETAMDFPTYVPH